MHPLEREQMRSDLEAVRTKVKTNRTDFPANLLKSLEKSPLGIVKPELVRKLKKTRAKAAQREAARQSAQEILKQLEHFDTNYSRIWAGGQPMSPRPRGFGHQRQAENSVLRRRQEIAEQLHAAYWERPISSKSVLNLDQIQSEPQLLQQAGHLSEIQAKNLAKSLSELAEIRGKAGHDTIDPNTYRAQVIRALGASEEESRHANNWSYQTVRAILQAESIPRRVK